MDIDSPKSEPEKSYEKTNTEKAGKDVIASKPDDKPKNNKIDYKDKKIEASSQKPKDKPKNKIEPRKIDIQKEPRNKIKLRQMDIQKEPRNKIQRQKSNPLTPPRNKIKLRQMNIQKEPRNRIQPQRSKNRIERNPASEPKNSANPEVSQLSLEKIKGELKKFNWKTISENWTVKVSVNKEITLKPYELPSKENPLYKHKEWLQTVYNHKTWNLNDNMLRKISGVSNGTIYSWRNKLNVPTKQPKQKLFRDGKRKECGQCHQIKPIDKFGSRMSRGKTRLFSRCKKCKIEVNQVYRYKNKVKIIQNIYNGELNGKCQMCSTNVEKLPSLEFHHLDPKLKSGEAISMSRNWEETKKQVEREKATILCENCHTKQRSKYYNSHEKIIQENNLSPLASNNQISQYVKNKLPNANYEVRRQVKHSIKKQIIIDHLYEGKCVGCGDISTKDNLPALQFHHRDKNNPYKMSKTYDNLRYLENKEIIKKLKEDNCIPLCGNCHRMEQSTQFKNNYEKIVNPEHWDNIKKNYEMIENNIKNFKFT
jgi:hypothetical protein